MISSVLLKVRAPVDSMTVDNDVDANFVMVSCSDGVVVFSFVSIRSYSLFGQVISPTPEYPSISPLSDK